ncbi:MAG: trigger factor [Deltaproteobacteria bacterium]|nr:trigger factor [Deltaproteobacteria bacterium]
MMQQSKYDMSIEVEDISAVKKKLNIRIPSENVAEEIKRVYRDIRANASVAGFRKGAVPVNVIKARFGDKVREDVTTRLIENTYPQALHEKKIEPVERPKVDIATREIEEGGEFAYSVTFEVNPRVDVDGYIGMELKRENTEVTDKDVEDGLLRLCQAHVQFKEVDRPAEDGDMVTIDFEGRRGSEPIKGAKATDYPVIVGDAMPAIPGMGEALKGLKKGDRKDVTITFPGEAELKDPGEKETVFAVIVKAVKEKVMHAIDTEFAKDLGCEDIGKLREKVRSELKRAREESAKEALKTRILDSLIERYSFDVPESTVNRYHAMILGNIVENMRRGSVAQEDKGLKPEEIKEKYHKEAVRRVKEDIILDAIVAREKTEVTDEETEAAMRHLAGARGVSYDSLMSRIHSEGNMNVIKDGLKHEKVFEKIISLARFAD